MVPSSISRFSPRRPGVIAALVLGLAASAGAQAQVFGSAPAAAEPDQWALGVAVVSRQQAYAGADPKNNVLPLLFYDNRWLRVAGTSADLKLMRLDLSPTQTLSAGLRVRYDGDGYEADDSPQLAGMAERKAGFWGGAGAQWRTPWAQVSVEWMADLSGNSKGQKLQLGVERRFDWGPLSLTPRVRAQWADRKAVDYYYGVRADEARSGRAAYAGQSAMLVEAGLRMDYSLARHHGVFVDVGVTRLPNEIKDSPIVDRGNLSRVMLGYMYRF